MRVWGRGPQRVQGGALAYHVIVGLPHPRDPEWNGPTTKRICSVMIKARACLLGMTLLAGPAWGATPSIGTLMGGIAPLLAGAGGGSAPALTDLGKAAIGSPTAMTVYLAPRDPAKLASFVAALQTPGDPNFHKFITRAEFVSRFGPTGAQVAAVKSAFRQLGFTIGVLYPNHLALEVTAPASTVASALGVGLERMQLAGRIGTVPTAATRLPASVAGLVRGVGGFSTLSGAHSGLTAGVQAASGALSGLGVPGHFTPADYEKRYDVMPLVQAGATGNGTTIAIVTLSDFKAADAATFYADIGVTVGARHVTKVDVDGGTIGSTPYHDGDPGESDLDVQQSGAIAPNARVLAYVTPNISSATFLNGFEAAASDNLADVVSCSWGEAELNYFANALTGGVDETFYLQAFHDVFEEMATQGQTVFTDADDNGAFEVNRFQYPVFPKIGKPPAYTPVYSIHHPSSDPLVTAAGGTTVPFSETFADRGGVTVTVSQEQAWSWSYFPLGALAQNLGLTVVADDFEKSFAVGGGGGVSIYWGVPGYQNGLAGVTSTMPDQVLLKFGKKKDKILATEPSGFAGRNIPDLSANADPESGYFYVQDGAPNYFYGGTSFVAPQFAGTVALIVELLGHRVGQLNPQLYALQASGASAARDISKGDIWGYVATPGYDDATGLGVMDAAKLYEGLRAGG